MENKIKKTIKLQKKPYLNKEIRSIANQSESSATNQLLSINTLFGNFIKFFVIPAIIIILALKIFAIRTFERELYFSSEAFVTRQEISVGSDGYGEVSSINVKEGDYVNRGDILYKYYNGELDRKITEAVEKGLSANLDKNDGSNITLNSFNNNLEFIARARRSGYIKNINITLGEYVTKDVVVMSIDTSDVIVKASLKVPPDQIKRIAPGLRVLIEIPNNGNLYGVVQSIRPEYDSNVNTLEINISIPTRDINESEVTNLYSGTPVNATVITHDKFTESFRSFVNSIPISFIKDFLSYEL